MGSVRAANDSYASFDLPELRSFEGRYNAAYLGPRGSLKDKGELLGF